MEVTNMVPRLSVRKQANALILKSVTSKCSSSWLSTEFFLPGNKN